MTMLFRESQQLNTETHNPDMLTSEPQHHNDNKKVRTIMLQINKNPSHLSITISSSSHYALGSTAIAGLE